ncbi:MAG TPA: hypothetical protein VNE39_01440 [Planctomycetota bacterium]|nr:hypothetical protein [Planctomycetota bacterium]
MKDRVAYEFFCGLGDKGAPLWTPEVKERKPVFSDPNGVGNAGLAHVVFHPGLRRYTLTLGHRPKGEKTMAAVACLGVFDAPEPWGPWTTVAYYDDWGGLPASECLGYDIPAKWISPDGTAMWCVFSSTGKLDSLNLVKATLTLRNAPVSPQKTEVR